MLGNAQLCRMRNSADGLLDQREVRRNILPERLRLEKEEEQPEDITETLWSWGVKA